MFSKVIYVVLPRLKQTMLLFYRCFQICLGSTPLKNTYKSDSSDDHSSMPVIPDTLSGIHSNYAAPFREVDTFFRGALSYELCSSQLLHGECSRFDGFQEQMTEAPVKLTIYMFTNLLLGYIQYHL